MAAFTIFMKEQSDLFRFDDSEEAKKALGVGVFLAATGSFFAVELASQQEAHAQIAPQMLGPDVNKYFARGITFQTSGLPRNQVTMHVAIRTDQPIGNIPHAKNLLFEPNNGAGIKTIGLGPASPKDIKPLENPFSYLELRDRLLGTLRNVIVQYGVINNQQVIDLSVDGQSRWDCINGGPYGGPVHIQAGSFPGEIVIVADFRTPNDPQNQPTYRPWRFNLDKDGPDLCETGKKRAGSGQDIGIMEKMGFVDGMMVPLGMVQGCDLVRAAVTQDGEYGVYTFTRDRSFLWKKDKITGLRIPLRRTMNGEWIPDAQNPTAFFVGFIDAVEKRSTNSGSQKGPNDFDFLLLGINFTSQNQAPNAQIAVLKIDTNGLLEIPNKYEERQNVPNPDSDGDGIPDDKDRMPGIANPGDEAIDDNNDGKLDLEQICKDPAELERLLREGKWEVLCASGLLDGGQARLHIPEGSIIHQSPEVTLDQDGNIEIPPSDVPIIVDSTHTRFAGEKLQPAKKIKIAGPRTIRVAAPSLRQLDDSGDGKIQFFDLNGTPLPTPEIRPGADFVDYGVEAGGIALGVEGCRVKVIALPVTVVSPGDIMPQHPDGGTNKFWGHAVGQGCDNSSCNIDGKTPGRISGDFALILLAAAGAGFAGRGGKRPNNQRMPRGNQDIGANFSRRSGDRKRTHHPGDR